MITDSLELPDEILDGFLAEHRLPDSFRWTAIDHYLPLAGKLREFERRSTALLLGINGAQGTGKSTLADFLQLTASELFGWRSAVVSIDDFYLTRAERESLAHNVHPLLATRGVPGTHDAAMMKATLDQLGRLGPGESLQLPRFDKSIDDRAPSDVWPIVTGPIDLVILEGWCVGSRSQPAEALTVPTNALERDEDPDAIWRTYANDALRCDYEPLFSRLDALVFLAAPSFEAVYRWRLEQEQKLAARKGIGAGIMNEGQVARFIRFYERLTRHNLKSLSETADVVMTLDEDHRVTASRYKE